MSVPRDGSASAPAAGAGAPIYSGPVPAGVNVDVVRDVVSLHLPEFTIADVVACGEGQDNVAFDVDGELIVRFRKEATMSRERPS